MQCFTETEPAPEDGKLPEVEKGKRFKKINWLRAGILTADKVVTVSPNYASEISTNAQRGVELDDVIRWGLALG